MARLTPVPLYLAGVGPKSIQLAAELADGWLGIHCPPEYVSDAAKIIAGTARWNPADFDIAVMVQVLVEDDLELARDLIRPSLALYLGGMGTRSTNYYNRLAAQLGFAAEARVVHQAYLDGRVDEAIAAITDELVDAMSICGPPDRVRDRLGAYSEAGASTLIAGIVDSTRPGRMDQLGRLAELACLRAHSRQRCARPACGRQISARLRRSGRPNAVSNPLSRIK